MNYLDLLYQLPAIVAGTTLVAYLSPVKIAPRATPLIMFLVGLIVMMLPVMPDLALAMTLPTAWLSNVLGISFTSHEPVNLGPAVEKARSAARTARERIRKAEGVEVTAFAAHAYPAPGDAPEAADAEHDPGEGSTESTGTQEPSPADAIRGRLADSMSDPRLPPDVRQRLGQRPEPGMGSQHAPVRPFVPAI